MGRMGGRGYGGGGRGGGYTNRYTVTTRMTCIKTGSDESHFNVSLIVRDKVTRPCPQTTTFEEKGEPKRIRTEVPLRTSLTPYRWAKAAHVTPLMGHSLYTHFNASPSGILSPNSATIGNATNWTLYLHFICSSIYI